MASIERFELLCDKASDAAEKALGQITNTTGSERGKLFASLATMWLETARLEHDQLAVQALEQRVRRIDRRLYAIEAALKLRADETPDIFAEES